MILFLYDVEYDGVIFIVLLLQLSIVCPIWMMMTEKSRNNTSIDIQNDESNEMPQSKIDDIIAKLRQRKKQMMEHSNSINNNYINTQQSKNVTNLQRLHKYKEKAEVQNAEIKQLSSHLQCMQEKSFKATVELENK